MQHCAGFISAVILHFSGASAHHQEYLKLVRRPLVHVLSLQVSHHISLLGPELNACWEGYVLMLCYVMYLCYVMLCTYVMLCYVVPSIPLLPRPS